MPYAPELRAAFLCVCGTHGYVKPDGHFMDDLWAYDIPAHRWLHGLRDQRLQHRLPGIQGQSRRGGPLWDRSKAIASSISDPVIVDGHVYCSSGQPRQAVPFPIWNH